MATNKQPTPRQEKKLAAALEQCLELVLNEGHSIDAVVAAYPQFATELKDELEAAQWLHQRARNIEPLPGFTSLSRRRLMRQIETEKPRHPRRQPAGFALRPALRLAFTFLLVVGLILSSTGVASARALPGERLYPVKITIEEARLSLNRDTEKEIRLHLRFANRRVDESENLAQQGGLEQITPALQNYQAHIGQSAQLLTRLAIADQLSAQRLAAQYHAELSAHLETFEDIEKNAPADPQSELTQTIQQAQLVRQQIQASFGLDDLDEAPESGDSPEVDSSAAGTATTNPSPVVTTETTTSKPSSSTPAETATPAESSTPLPSHTPQATEESPPPTEEAPAPEAPTSPPDPPDNGDDGGGNPNDDKDSDPDDGNAGKGNDDNPGKGKGKDK